MEKYRKLSATELDKMFHLKSNSENHKQYINWAKKYFPANVCSLLVSFVNEYDDERYSGGVKYVIAYDKDANEVSPLKGKEKEARDTYGDFSDGNGENDYEPKEDLIIHLNTENIELYVKDNGTSIIREAQLENTEDGHSKTWQATLYSNGELIVFWGRIGAEPQSKKHEGMNEEDFDKLVNSKLKKGYTINKN